MLSGVLRSIFGSHNDRIIKKYSEIVKEINALEKDVEKLSGEELQAKTISFKEQFSQGETLENLLIEVFAVAREASKRVLGMRPFDVQLIGGMVLNDGRIAEMKTGEGKTLVAVLPVYLNAISGRGVHVVTVNDYLARRDAEWMGKIYKFLGMSVGVITSGMSDSERKEAYNCDITYATNNELGFDYLRDNMKFYSDHMVMREFNYAIVDEVDSILIDEARTPLIISGATEDSASLYEAIDALVSQLQSHDFELDEKNRNIMLTESGNVRIEQLLADSGLLRSGNLYDISNIVLVHHVNQALKAHHLFKRDTDYIVKSGKVIIIDEFTGRMMDGRRYSDGLHQAIEAKEGVRVQMENQTLASITFQNFFRMYNKLAGMTGTAITEAQEFIDIYKLETVVIPTNIPVTRVDLDDEIYRTASEKYFAILDVIKDCYQRGQPILVGTISIERSEYISSLLKKENIPHQVLNARYHDVEAQIIAQAGKPYAVTIATNMAGRGTDIKLGGNLEDMMARDVLVIDDATLRHQKEISVQEEITKNIEFVKSVGGLYVLGTERHESRRIDNQLRGRSGRQGDPGKSKFFLSLEDDLMRIFGAETLDKMLVKLGLEKGEAIIHPWVNKAIEKAQVRVEARNYDIRKHLLKFDDVMNDQRKVIYSQRKELMNEETDISGDLEDMMRDSATEIGSFHVADNTPSQYWDFKAINDDIVRRFGPDTVRIEQSDNLSRQDLVDTIFSAIKEKIDRKIGNHSHELIMHIERSLLLKLIDQSWKEHLLNLDKLRQGINLRAYGQRDPLNEYKQEAFVLFESMVSHIRNELVKALCLFELPNNIEAIDQLLDNDSDDSFLNNQDLGIDDEEISNELKNAFLNSGRNSLCPCGSGKKFKWCHGKIDE